jgi:hypothetical protein
MTKNSHKHFDVEYDMSQMIKNSHKHFDMEYDMKINTNFMIQFIVCNVSYKNKNWGQKQKKKKNDVWKENLNPHILNY